MDSSGDAVNDSSGTRSTPPPPAIPTLSAAVSLESVKERALEFFSNASNETLGACLVGLGATTYIVLGRVGLVLIGVVGGIALHASWENNPNNGDGADAKNRKKLKLDRRNEMGIEVARRVLDWRELHPVAVNEESVADVSDFVSFRPETAQALDVLVDAATRDYIK